MSTLPLKKVDEIINLFTSPAIKNLNGFSELGKVKSTLKKAMQDLESTDPVQANTGLGILYEYENNLTLSLEAFKKAYNLSGHGRDETIHYANAEFSNGDQSIGVSLYLDLIEKKAPTQGFIRNIIWRFLTYLYLDELEVVLQNPVVVNLVDEAIEKEIYNVNILFNILQKNHISLEYYRKLRNLPNSILHKYYTTTTKFMVEHIVDIHRNEVIYSYVLPVYPNQLYGNNLLSKVNDELQIAILDLNKEYRVGFSSPEDLITMFFSVKDALESVA